MTLSVITVGLTFLISTSLWSIVYMVLASRHFPLQLLKTLSLSNQTFRIFKWKSLVIFVCFGYTIIRNRTDSWPLFTGNGNHASTDRFWPIGQKELVKTATTVEIWMVVAVLSCFKQDTPWTKRVGKSSYIYWNFNVYWCSIFLEIICFGGRNMKHVV